MATWNGELFQYCDYTITLVVTKNGQAYNLANCTLVFAAKKKVEHTDEEAVIYKSSTGSDQIKITNAAAGEAELYLNTTDTSNMASDYPYGLKLIDAQGEKHPLVAGTLKLRPFGVVV